MALIIVRSTGDFQIRCNVLSLSFSERESEKWLLGLSDYFYHNYLTSNDCIQHSVKIIYDLVGYEMQCFFTSWNSP